MPTILCILQKNPAKVILASHLGRPKGPQDTHLSMEPVRKRLLEMLDHQSDKNKVELLENLRFHPEEEGTGCSPEAIQQFRSHLTSMADVFVNDAFGAMHRAHSSIVGVDVHPRVAGLLVEKEIKALQPIVDVGCDVLVLGGAKVRDKLVLLQRMLGRRMCRHVLIGGGMAFTFLHHNGTQVGMSLLDASVDVEALYEAAARNNIQLHLPLDYVCSKSVSGEEDVRLCEGDIPSDFVGVDIGPKTAAHFCTLISGCKSAFWNGPMGVAELEAFARGTRQVALAMSAMHEQGGCAIIGTLRTKNN